MDTAEPILIVMASSSFFIQSSEDALRHVNLLAKGLKKVAIPGLVGGAGCGVMAVALGHVLVTPSPSSNALPGFHELSGITFVASFMAIALLLFSSLYFIAGWGLSHQKAWARYTAAATFIAKVVLCVWLGRGSVVAMIVFLLIAGLDLYGLWVLLSAVTGQLFSSPQARQANVKPANLVT
jgi:hypothetical protein